MSETPAQIVSAPGIGGAGQVIVRGWRVLCDCGYLSRVKNRRESCRKIMRRHKCGQPTLERNHRLGGRR